MAYEPHCSLALYNRRVWTDTYFVNVMENCCAYAENITGHLTNFGLPDLYTLNQNTPRHLGSIPIVYNNSQEPSHSIPQIYWRRWVKRRHSVTEGPQTSKNSWCVFCWSELHSSDIRQYCGTLLWNMEVNGITSLTVIYGTVWSSYGSLQPVIYDRTQNQCYLKKCVKNKEITHKEWLQQVTSTRKKAHNGFRQVFPYVMGYRYRSQLKKKQTNKQNVGQCITFTWKKWGNI